MKTRRNRRSRFTAEHYPVVKVRPEGLAARRRTGGGSSDPLVSDLRGRRARIRGSMYSGRDTRRRLEDQPANRRCFAGRPESRLGDRPELFSYSSGAFSRRERYLRSGGDEETRTPDLLLAKEMLCQLSYVPRATEDGGRFWTRTRDLCLIRAVL